MKEAPKPHNSESAREIEKMKDNFDAFEGSVKAMTMDRMANAPKEETESHVKKSQNELAAMKDVYLKPKRTVSSRERFNENFRKDYEHAKEYVNFIAENKELIGETMELWTKPFAGVPAEEWVVPANKPVWGPRYLAEQLGRKFYHRLVMKESFSGNQGSDQFGTKYGTDVAVDTTIPRIECNPYIKRTTTFFGDSGRFG